MGENGRGKKKKGRARRSEVKGVGKKKISWRAATTRLVPVPKEPARRKAGRQT